MKIKTLLLASLALLATSTSCYAESREQALKPHINKVWDHWSDFPAEYKRLHQATLKSYLDLFTTSNGYTWNREWQRFTSEMGPEFQPLYSDVIETMKVAEAFETCFPNAEQKIDNIAGVIFNNTPTNALLFIHNDVLETILFIKQQTGFRDDVLIINSSRMMDNSYMKIVQGRYPEHLMFSVTNLSQQVFDIAEQRKLEGDAEFKGLQCIDGKINAKGVQLLNSLALLMMKEVSKTMPDRPVSFLPSLHTREPVVAWHSLKNNGLFFTWKDVSTSRNVMQDWETLLDASAPSGSSVHVEMANAVGQSIYAAADILNAQGEQEVSDKLLKKWSQRAMSVTMVSGKDIIINKENKMVQQPD